MTDFDKICEDSMRLNEFRLKIKLTTVSRNKK